VNINGEARLQKHETAISKTRTQSVGGSFKRRFYGKIDGVPAYGRK
jgi:hypothetical protein